MPDDENDRTDPITMTATATAPCTLDGERADLLAALATARSALINTTRGNPTGDGSRHRATVPTRRCPPDSVNEDRASVAVRRPPGAGIKGLHGSEGNCGPLKTRDPGRTGIQVSHCRLGTMTFRQASDTRDNDMPTTKVNDSMGENLNRGGSSRRWIVTGVEHAPRHPQTDHIDLYQRDPQRFRSEQRPYSLHNRGIGLDTVGQVTPLADEAGPRTREQLEDLPAGAPTTLDDEVLNKIDQIAKPGTDIGPLDVSYPPPAITRAALRRRSADERAVA